MGVISRSQQMRDERRGGPQYPEGENHAEKVKIIGKENFGNGYDRWRSLKGNKYPDLIFLPQICGFPLGQPRAKGEPLM